MSITMLYAELRKKFSISTVAHINRLILITVEIVDSIDLLEKGDRIWVELRIDQV